MGHVRLRKENPSVRLTNDVGVKFESLYVDTGPSVLATVSFGETGTDQGLYLDELYLSTSSYLEFDLSRATIPSHCYVFVPTDYSHMLNRIGFRDPDGSRYSAKIVYESWGGYRITPNEFREWYPPMVPEPSAYGAGLMGLGVAVACYRSHFRLRRRQAGRINRVIRLSHF